MNPLKIIQQAIVQPLKVSLAVFDVSILILSDDNKFFKLDSEHIVELRTLISNN